jgi:hypothetical protein
MEDASIFQIVSLELNWDDDISVRRVLQPSYELLEDAMALAEFDASRCGGDYGYDDVLECWWACDDQGRKYRFVIEQISPAPGQISRPNGRASDHLALNNPSVRTEYPMPKT